MRRIKRTAQPPRVPETRCDYSLLCPRMAKATPRGACRPGRHCNLDIWIGARVSLGACAPLHTPADYGPRGKIRRVLPGTARTPPQAPRGRQRPRTVSPALSRAEANQRTACARVSVRGLLSSGRLAARCSGVAGSREARKDRVNAMIILISRVKYTAPSPEPSVPSAHIAAHFPGLSVQMKRQICTHAPDHKARAETHAPTCASVIFGLGGRSRTSTISRSLVRYHTRLQPACAQPERDFGICTASSTRCATGRRSPATALPGDCTPIVRCGSTIGSGAGRSRRRPPAVSGSTCGGRRGSCAAAIRLGVVAGASRRARAG